MTMQLDERYLPLIGGSFQARSDAWFDAIDPATGAHLAKIARCGADEIDAAARAAREALPGWRATPAAERAQCLLRLADAIAADIDRLAEIDARDIGRRLAETRMDHQFAISQYRYFAAAVVTMEDFGGPTPNGHFIAMREPIGVCGQIIPWNVPAIMTAFKLAPALAAGNTVVLKPDENASLSTLVLAQKLADIFPPGVVNVVPGFGEEAGAALTAHPHIAKIAFTGSSEIGRVVATAGAQRLVPVSLELGGKSPNIVFPDIEDLDAVVDNAAFAATFCNGQSCLAGTRLFVHDDIYATFVDKLAAGSRSCGSDRPWPPTPSSVAWFRPSRASACWTTSTSAAARAPGCWPAGGGWRCRSTGMAISSRPRCSRRPTTCASRRKRSSGRSCR